MMVNLRRFLLLSGNKTPAQKILEERHAMRVTIIHQEKSFQDLLPAAVMFGN
jgi:hypothetical protein